MPLRALQARLLQLLCLLALLPALLLAGREGLGAAHAAEPQAEALLRIEAGMHTAAVNRIDTDAAGRYAVTASGDKTARVWDVASGRLLQVLRPPLGAGDEGKLFAVAIAPDGATVAAAGWTGASWSRQLQVYLFDRSSGRLLRRLGGLDDVVYHLAYSPDGRWLAATLGGRQGLRVWDLRARADARAAAPLADTAYGAPSYGATWSGDGRLATSSYDGQLRLYRLDDAALAARSLKPLAQARVDGGQRPFALAFHPDGSRIALAYDDSARIDLLDGQTLARWPGPAPATGDIERGDLGSLAWSADGRQLAAAGTWVVQGRKAIRLWDDGGRGQPRDVPATGTTVMHLAALPSGGWLVAAGDPAWGVLDAAGRWTERGAPPTADLRGSLGQAFVLAFGGRQLQFGFLSGGEAPHQFDLQQRQLTAGMFSGGTMPDVQRVALQDWLDGDKPTLHGRPLALKPFETTRSLAAFPDGQGFALGSSYALRLYGADGQLRRELPVPGEVWGVNIVGDGAQAGKLLVAAYGDGTLRWHRLSDGRELLALFAHADRRRWVLWTPGGYFDASPGAEDLIGWHLNRGQDQAADFFPASRLRARFWRPDIIDRVLDTLDEAQAVAQANRPAAGAAAAAPGRPPAAPSAAAAAPAPAATATATATAQGGRPNRPPGAGRPPPSRPPAAGNAASPAAPAAVAGASPMAGQAGTAAQTLTQLLPPVVDLLSGSDVQTDQPRVRIRVQARSAADAPVTAWGVRINGESVADVQGLAVPAGGDGGQARELSVPVPPRDVELRVFASNRHGASSAVVVRVAWAGQVPAAQAAPEFQIQPKLYVLAIGVGQYQYPEVPSLGELPAKDARDFARAVQQQSGGLYRAVEVRVLTDQEATRDNVMDALDWLQRQPTQHDVSMLFLSGHGVNDPAMGYLYLPVNAHIDRFKRTAVSAGEIKNTLVSMAGKRVLFMDTCHAGNVMGGMSARAAFNDISGVLSDLASSENGLVVFSSSTGRQYSLQDPSWGNGAFSKALVEGLGGAAAHGKRRYITHKMLSFYVSERVKELTKGLQTPVNPDPIGVPDFPVAMVPGP